MESSFVNNSNLNIINNNNNDNNERYDGDN